ncbi:MAG: hypothetical protein JJE22_14350 [Bacteroidia bacterium]|nr:hypothetical protein [Bacteroidia bacterium]
MNASELIDKYLSVLYLKSKDNLAKGYNVYIIAKLIGIDDDMADYVKDYLQRNGLIENLHSASDPITILSATGLDYVFKLRENKVFKIIRFTRSQYLPPEGMATYDFIYSYTLIEEDGKMEKNTIKVSISNVLSLIWKFDHTELEKVLCQFAKDRVIEKLKYGTLRKLEELVLLRKSHPDKCPYDSQNLIEPVFAEYEVETGQKLLTEKTNKGDLMRR